MNTNTRSLHVARIERRYKGKTYVTILLRRSFRDGKAVQHETLGNLSHLPERLIDIIRRALQGEEFASTSERFRIIRSWPHGHVQAVLGMITKLGLNNLLAAKPSRQRNLVIAMIAERLLFPSSKLATTRHWHSTTLAEELGVADASVDELYQAMDWLLTRQQAIENQLAGQHLAERALVLYDVSSSFYEGHSCPLARYGHDRDGQTGRPIIVYGVLTDGEGRPVAVDVYPGNTGDPTTVPDQVAHLQTEFGIVRMVLVGDRGMLTEAQLRTLRTHPGLGWISALRSPAIRALIESGTLQLSLFDQQHLAEITAPEYPGERLIACFNPLLADERRRKREELLVATERALTKIATAAARRTKTPFDDATLGIKVGRVI